MLENIEKFVEKYNLPKFRLKQFNYAYYIKAIPSFDQLTTWPENLRKLLKKEIEFISLEEVKASTSEDKSTLKALFRRKKDHQLIETVLMKHEDKRNTVCVSCMVGCPVNCSFCATGKMGFRGNLTTQEIVDQVMYFQRILLKQDEKVTNIVFMGMGEPMLNLDNVMESIEIFTNEEKLAMGSRRITLSTAGFINEIEQVMEEGFKGRLAVSLHAPNQELREKLMPVAKTNKLDELFKILDKYVERTNKRITYEYILIQDVNDTLEHAEDLAELLRNRLSHVNLIPYNPIKGVDFKAPSRNSIHKFARVLDKYHISHTIRITMGDDIQAACGQLAGEIIACKTGC